MKDVRAARLVAIVAALNFAFAGSAYAGDRLTVGESPAAVASSTRDDGRQVPFTALDVVLLLAGGGALVASGAGVRRASRSRA